MCYDMQDWESTPEEYIETYSFIDKEQIYTNGSKLIPVFRVEDMLEHYYKERTCKPVTEVLETIDIGIGSLEKLVDNCSYCGEPLTVEYSINALWRRVLPNYCSNCGAKVVI